MGDPLSDLLGDMNDLDDALFGKKPGASKPKSALDTLFGDSKTQRKPTVTFGGTTTAGPKPPGPSKSALDDIFAEPKASAGGRPGTSGASRTSDVTSAPSTSQPRPTRRQAAGLGDLFGTPSKEQSSQPTPQVTAAAPVTSAAPSATLQVESAEAQLRIQRLENEVGRLNREIDELKRKKKDDEDVLEREFKEKLTTKENAWRTEMEETQREHARTVQKLTDQQAEEVQRLKEGFDRQLDIIQQTAGQTKEVSQVVDKVDLLTTTLDKLTGDVNEATERVARETELSLRLREQQIQLREDNFEREIARLHEEKDQVHELNAKLKELCKQQEQEIQQEKWKIREEWNRLNAERKVFKEDQNFILENIEKQKLLMDRSKEAFFREQHDLLIRVSNEKHALEHEKNQFHLKRTADMNRLKDEALQLQHRIRNVELAEEHAQSLRQHYESKYRQLQELEASLMEECIEIENLRNKPPERHSPQRKPKFEVSHSAPPQRSHRIGRSSSGLIPKIPDDDLLNNMDASARNDSVRAVLRKHSDFLGKYIGQKVAAVAPRSTLQEDPQ